MNRIYRWLVFVCVVFLSGTIVYAAMRHAIAQHWASSSSPDMWLKAATSEPANADNWYRLGRYRELDFEHGDVALAIAYYRRATTLEPLDALFWLDLAGAYETAGNLNMAEQSYRQAQGDYPISGEVAWRYGNFLLRQDRIEEAFRQIQHAVSVDPKLAALAVSRCWQSTRNVDQILQFALPNDSEVYWGAIEFFLTAQQYDAAMAVWERLAAQSAVLPLNRESQFLESLIESGRIDDAVRVWRHSLPEVDVQPLAAGRSLIWDGGFERNLANVGFAWRFRPVQGVDFGWDEDVAHSGQRSLRLTFDTSEKIDFQQIWQYVAVEPSTTYQFRAYVRAQEFNTDSGIRFEIRDPQKLATPPSVTASVVGTKPWTLLESIVSTGPQTHLLQVSLRRDPSELLDGKLEGTVWIDDVSLVPSDPGEPH